MSVKQDYTEKVNKRFEDNKERIIQSFVEYYGKEYEAKIRDIYDKIIYIYYVGQNVTDLISSNNISEDVLSQDEVELYSVEKKLADSNMSEEERDKIRFVGNSHTENFNQEEMAYITNFVVNKTKRNTPKKLLWNFREKTNRLIFLPTYFWADSSIIHEINHHMTSEILLLVKPDSGEEKTLYRNGLDIDGDNRNSERIIEEIINELSALEITESFHKKGGSLVEAGIKKDIVSESPYRNSKYLVERFYLTFKEAIKKARISGDKNYLLEACGKENYYELVGLVNKYYDSDVTLEKQTEINAIIENMLSYNGKSVKPIEFD